MKQKPDLLVVLTGIFVVGVAISGYAQSRGLAQDRMVPASSISAPGLTQQQR